ncbi:MAG TPA: Gfo/Idh/MocA family oxidoreductase [Candidatus Acidoferrales bacterium]|nr:Gfo/Idh/MocA family oxidoreductase [Candidatus Acidoferrales bacterium]
MPESGNRPVLRFGIVGLGRAATSMLPSLVHHPQVKIAAAADLRKEALEKFKREFGAEVYGNAEDLFRSKSIDAVYIATPHQCHAEHVKMAAAYGKHAIVEKPMALTLEDCDSMIAAAERAGIKLLVGHTHSFDPPILKIREIVCGGELGKLGMIHTWRFTNFLYRPRRPEELDTSLGGGIIFNQVPHQVDMVRWIGGGLVRSVRSMTGIWDSSRPTEGAHVTYLEFVEGAAATIVYSAYDHFDSDQFTDWIGEGGERRPTDRHGSARRALAQAKNSQEEAAMKASTGYGGTQQRRAAFARGEGERYHPHFGVTVVSCERGDLRPGPSGVIIYDDHGKREVPVPLGRAVPDKGRVIDEFYDAIVHEQPVYHSGRWGKATLEVCLAILKSARERREVFLSYQVGAGG